MTAVIKNARRSRTRNRVFAISAAGMVLAAGFTVPSLAAWTDIEWLTGGVGNVPGVGTSTFNVQQFAAGDTVWGDYPTQAGANVVDFSAQAASLTPGDTVYGYVRLRTVAGSLGGDLALAADTVVTPSTLSEALSYGARIVPAVGDCTATGYGASATVLQAAGSALNATSSTSFALAAAADAVTPGAEKVVCFAITFPSSFSGTPALQGTTAVPVWHFDAVSS